MNTENSNNDKQTGSEAVSFLEPNKTVEAGQMPEVGGIDFSKVTDLPETQKETAVSASLEEGSKVFVGKAVSNKTKPFPNTHRVRRWRVKKSTLVIILIFTLLFGAVGYLGWRYYNEGPEFLATMFGGGGSGGEESDNKTTRFSCERTLDANELISLANPNSGKEYITLIYREGKFVEINKSLNLIYPNTSAGKNGKDSIENEYRKTIEGLTGGQKDPLVSKLEHKDGVVKDSHTIGQGKLTKKIAEFFSMPIEDGRVVTDFTKIRRHYGKPTGKYNCHRSGARI